MITATDKGCTVTYLGDAFIEKYTHVNLPYKRVVFNLEHPITTNDLPSVGKVNLKVNFSYLRELFPKQEIYVNLSNNHIFDYQEIGVIQTLNVLKSEKINYFGMYDHNYNEIGKNSITINDNQVINYSYCCKSANPIKNIGNYKIKILEDMKFDGVRHHKVGDKKVINIHWGDEEVTRPRVEHVKLARQLIDQGADLIIGHHPHCIQDFEIYHGKYIFYSLGNFIFDDINVGSYYDLQQKKFTKRYIKTQTDNNKRSLAITYDPEKESIKVDRIVYDNKLNTVYIEKENVKPNKLFRLTALLNSHYKFVKIKKLLKLSIQAYIYNPRTIQMKDIQYVIKVIKGK